MPCYYPIDAWRSAKVNPSGKRGIVFSRAEGFDDMGLQVPCGQCAGCRSDQAQAWAIRIYCESQLHSQNSFLTLTYADPAPPSIDKKHLQDFFKRLRHFYKFRYFACGEYGEQTRRPHYHAIIFGQDFLSGSQALHDGEMYVNDLVTREWGHGHVSIGSVTMSSACYVAGYCQKKHGDPDTFSLKSTRPGLAKAWLDRFYEEICRNGSIVVEGKELPVPPRFLDWYEEELADVKKERKARFDARTPEEVFRAREVARAKEKNRKAALRLGRQTI